MGAGVLHPGLVSVGIPTHNRSALLVRALRGVLAQSYRNIEVIVSNDASSDDTVERMREFNDPRIRFLNSTTNLGIAPNTNRCLEHASGELLLMLNDDDELEPTAIEELSESFRKPVHGIHPEKVAVTWCPCLVQTAERQVKWVTGSGPAVEPSIDLVVGMFDGTRGPRFCGVMIRTADARAVGGYTVRHGPIPDVGNWTQVALRREFAVCVSTPLARYTAHNSSCTGTSTARSWQQAGENIYGDLAAYLAFIGDDARLAKLKAGHRNFISGLLATIIMQGMGRPGWVKVALSEVVRAPQYFFTPMVARRLLKDGGKLLRRPQHD
jgi:glycosyltransferase involved in cell wall biosynthesis